MGGLLMSVVVLFLGAPAEARVFGSGSGCSAQACKDGVCEDRQCSILPAQKPAIGKFQSCRG